MAGYAEVCARYERAAPELRTAWQAIDLEDWLSPIAPYMRARTVLDIGAGSGRVAAYLTGRGARVTSVEPVSALWDVSLPLPIEDTLPRLRRTPLGTTRGTFEGFDLVLCLGVLHHLTPRDQKASLARLGALAKTGGHIALALRHGPGPTPSWPIRASRLTASGLQRVQIGRRPARQPANAARGVCFTWLVLRKRCA